MLDAIKRTFKYNGSMEYKPLNDEEIVSNYQHYFVVDKYREDIEGKNVLDAGCWTGPLEKVIVEKKMHVKLTGIDENAMALGTAGKKFPEFGFVKCGLVEDNREFIEKYKNFFDTVIFLDVIEHLPKGSEIKALKFFNQILKPGGVIVLSTMSSHIFNFVDPAWFFGHRHYRLKKLKHIFSKSGFRAEKILKIGNLFWDIDILIFYIYKHIFKKRYSTSSWMHEKINKGFRSPIISTRYYIKIRKK